MRNYKKLSLTDYFAVVILIIFFISNSIHIYRKDIFVDESISYFLVNKLSFIELLSGKDVHWGYYLLMKILPHQNFYLGRFYSLIITITALGLLYLFSNKLFGQKISVFVLLISSLSSTISEYATQFRMYSILFLLSVLIMYYFFEKKYKRSLFFIGLSIFFHYYSIFLLIPFFVTLFFIDSKNIKMYFMYIIFTLCVCTVFLMVPVYHQITDNSYRIPPPLGWVSLSSLPSMLIFPFIIPSSISSVFLLVYTFLIIILIIYLVVKFSHKKKDRYIFLIMSYFTTIIIFILSFKLYYHHRYIIMFFPMIYIILVKSITKHKYSNWIFLFIVSFLIITFIDYHINPNNQMIIISKEVSCPKNILHETPFSFLPFMIYLPDCNHYMSTSSDWSGVTHVTLYTEPEFIDNPNISYDIYYHYFDELKGIDLLNNTNSSILQLTKIEE